MGIDFGLDLGTNSIGWSVVDYIVEPDGEERLCGIKAAGSRIIPMDAAVLGDFEKGNAVSQTKDRTMKRGMRRLYERHHLRRERLHRVLNILGFLPPHYAEALTRYGKFKNHEEPKLPWRKDEFGQWQFIFQSSYEEMLELFRKAQPEWLAEGGKVPYDWTIYYLRKKALTRAVSKEELAWILLNFNQKRGYYQARGEEEQENTGKLEEYYALRVVDVVDSGDRKGKDVWYNIVLENGMIYRRTYRDKPDLVGNVLELIVTTDLNPDGSPKTDKDGKVKQSIRLPKEEDWTLQKKKTEHDIDNAKKTVAEFIFDALLINPKQKVRGKLVRVVERKYYKEELHRILETQKQFIPELQDASLYEACLKELYSSNEAYRNSIAGRDFTYLLHDNIIFYQRPLKSKKSEIADCPYESHTCVDRETGEIKEMPNKCISRSYPLFQEFRVWQFVSNLRIYERERIEGGVYRKDVDVTDLYITSVDDRVKLFEFLNDREDIKQDQLLAYFKIKKLKGGVSPCRWNYVEDKKYPCNETRGAFLKLLKKAGVDSAFLTPEIEEHLWHILYSVSDKTELRQAGRNFAKKHGLPEAFVEQFVKFPPFDSEYAAYSAKAIKKLLPLMRMGKYWHPDAIDAATRERIQRLLDGEVEDTVSDRVAEQLKGMSELSQFSGLPLWLACYVVYGRHSEAKDTDRWASPDDIDVYLRNFKQHSLRNPIVEQVVTETLRTVRDIWKQYGRPNKIHIELGRELRSNSEERKKRTDTILKNEDTNLRIKVLLTEMMNPEFGVEGIRPYSPSQQEILRIYEDGVLSTTELTDDIADIKKRLSSADVSKRPSRSDVLKYKLWLDQKYQSPYTGKVIPLAKLFTPAYEIEHIIPQSRYFDDSYANKVICEAEVNKLKDNQLGMEFIRNHSGEKVSLSMGGSVEILSVEEYQKRVQEQYEGNKRKREHLLMDDIPDQFIQRQMNDSRYISKLIKGLLSKIVREEGEMEATSKNIISTNGAITDRLKKDWGVNDAWNSIILPRFVRMNEIDHSSRFTAVSAQGHLIPAMPLDMQKGFNKKRIDHRHHAMDAIVIACTTRNHVNLLNNESAGGENTQMRYQLSRKLRVYDKAKKMMKDGQVKEIIVAKEFKKPWPSFTSDVLTTLNDIIVSFKQNQRIVTKSSNKYQVFRNGKKVFVRQTKGELLAIRKPLHKETFCGEINLRRIKEVNLKEAIMAPERIVEKDLKKKVKELIALGYDTKAMTKYFELHAEEWPKINLKKIKVYYFSREEKDRTGEIKNRFFATRKSLDTSFTAEKIEKSIADTGIQKILWHHLSTYGNDAELAFSPEGIEALNRNIVALNDGKPHQPILKVRTYEKGDKFNVGQRGSKSSKFVEAAKGTNLFFAIYEEDTEDKDGQIVRKRSYASVPLNLAIERQKQGLPAAPENANGMPPKFVLSPNDLVYVPTAEERKSGKMNLPLDHSRIYKMVSCTGSQCLFLPFAVAAFIVNGKEFEALNKIGRALTGEMIHETCIPLKVNRLGSFEVDTSL
ncbi:MAG: HNH endonuclease domain-containing protein [Bacteroidales bacterium]|nr:HNH endonuclease domain-containing protein [Bacteroidales bacterium]